MVCTKSALPHSLEKISHCGLKLRCKQGRMLPAWSIVHWAEQVYLNAVQNKSNQHWYTVNLLQTECSSDMAQEMRRCRQKLHFLSGKTSGGTNSRSTDCKLRRWLQRWKASPPHTWWKNPKVQHQSFIHLQSALVFRVPGAMLPQSSPQLVKFGKRNVVPQKQRRERAAQQPSFHDPQKGMRKMGRLAATPGASRFAQRQKVSHPCFRWPLACISARSLLKPMTKAAARRQLTVSTGREERGVRLRKSTIFRDSATSVGRRSYPHTRRDDVYFVSSIQKKDWAAGCMEDNLRRRWMEAIR